MDSKTELDLKEGHALPAVKLAGGVRVKPHKHHAKEAEKTKERSNSESSDTEENSIPSKVEKHHPIISGAQTKGDADFQADAIRAYQEKPIKFTNECMNGTKHNIIHQPKKY